MDIKIDLPRYRYKTKIITDTKEINKLVDKYKKDNKAKFLIDNKEAFICSINLDYAKGECEIEYVELEG